MAGASTTGRVRRKFCRRGLQIVAQEGGVVVVVRGVDANADAARRRRRSVLRRAPEDAAGVASRRLRNKSMVW